MNDTYSANELTLPRQKILDYIIEYQKENLNFPTVRQIGEAVGLSSTSSVTLHINKLCTDGYLEKTARRGIYKPAGYIMVKADKTDN